MAACGSGYAQIATYLRGRFRSLAGPDDHAYAPLSTLPASLAREEFLNASPLPDAVNKFLLQLDIKMDALLAGMQHSAMEHDFPHEMEILTLSASGLDFTTPLPLAPGDWLEIVVNFLQMGTSAVSGIGNVTARRVEMNGTPIFSLTFTRIAEENREIIIRHVFREERRQIRETRLD